MTETTGERGGVHPSVVAYLLVNDAASTIGFLEQAFGATRRFVKPLDSGGIMHAEIALGDSLLMISDAAPATGPVHLCHYVNDTDAVYARALAAGAASVAEPKTQEHGDREAGIKDPAGSTWWICQRIR